MYRGTTPTITLTVDGLSEINLRSAYLTIMQTTKEQRVVIEKTLGDMSIDGEVVSVTLSQADTLKLKANVKAEVQLRFLSQGGTAYATQITKYPVKEILKDGEIE